MLIVSLAAVFSIVTNGKECCLDVSSRLWGGALRDDTKNGCEGDKHVEGLFTWRWWTPEVR